MIQLHHISAGYAHKEKIQDIHTTFAPGCITVLVGENGSGKSTLLKTAAGLLKPMCGFVTVGGEEKCVRLDAVSDRVRAQQIAYLPQTRNIPAISVERLVLHGRFPYLAYPRVYRREDHIVAGEVIQKMGIGHLKGRSVAELSGGERQKVYIAMALAQDTPVVLFDEPDAFLDIVYRLELLELLGQLREEGKTVVTVMHDLDAALRIADHMIVMKKGRICADAAPSEVLASGILEEVFRVHIEAVPDAKGEKHYYFEKAKNGCK